MRFSLLALASLASAQTLQEALESQPLISNLTAYLSLYPALISQVESLTNITLLAPSNDAFAAAQASPEGFPSAADLVNAVFSYHVLNGTFMNFSSVARFVPTMLMPGDYAGVTGGQVVEAIAYDDSEGAAVSFFSGLYQNSSLVQTLDVINATNTTNLTSTASTVTFANGVIHVIDRFLTLPVNLTNTAIELNLQSSVGALQVTNLTEPLGMMSDVTIFVPDNAAFQAIGSSIATSTPEDLAKILEYHVVNGSVLYSTSLEDNTTLTTMNGINVDISVEGGEVYVNSAKVVTPNVLIANGVIHVIDNVLNPGNRTAVPNTSASTQAPAFSDASSASDVPFTSGIATATSAINTEGPSQAPTPGETSSSSSGGAMPRETGAMAAAALFGGAAVLMNM